MALEEWTSIFNDKIEELNRADSWHLNFSKSIVADSPGPGWKQYIRNAMASFTCSKCKRYWTSNRVMVLFHMRLAAGKPGKGTVKVNRFRQNCKRCTAAPMETPRFPPDIIDSLLEKLMEKIRQKCYGEPVGEINRSFRSAQVQGPHEPAHCEACMQGVCSVDKDSTAKDLTAMFSDFSITYEGIFKTSFS